MNEGPLQLAHSAGYGVLFGLSAFCIVYLRRYQSSAYSGDVEATRKVILPAFESLFWVLCMISMPYTVYFFWALVNDARRPTKSLVLLEILLQGRQCIVYIVTLFLHQPNVSNRTLINATGIAVLLAVIPVLLTVVYLQINPIEPPQVTTALLYYLLISYRAGIVCYYIYLLFFPMNRANPRIIRWFCAYIIGFHALAFIFMTLYYHGMLQSGARIVLLTSFYASVTPIWIWYLLKADTQYWRGLIHTNSHTCIDEAVSTKGIHDMLEMHRDYVIDFAHLKLDSKIGLGTNAQVFLGQLHGKYRVAIKVYAPREINQNTLAVFSQETARCTMFKHPNIVHFYGMCVQPPKVCLVTELCVCTLEERLTQSLTYVPQVLMMLDIARAVAYLHSFNPPYLHRDIKPRHVLVDQQHTLKLTDFAACRQLNGECLTMQGTPEYMAPEMINGERGFASYRESADIYSLAITFWDILHSAQEKYPTSYSNNFRLFELVLDGRRPHLQSEMHPVLEDLLEGMWCGTPEFRPSAASIVKVLESVQLSLVGDIAHELYHFPFENDSTVQSKYTLSLSGEALVNSLQDLHHTSSLSDSIRLGNALMDAGYLHHDRHCKPVDNYLLKDIYVLQISQSPLDCIQEDISIHGSTGRNYNDPAPGDCDCQHNAQGFYKRQQRTKNKVAMDNARSLFPMLAPLQQPSIDNNSIAIALLD
ncbi:kinase [Thraustotheca clavata]|uniref:Kinase n=1 Tax=Thraustotheca clavata TaxID=74557 RepID=A0A1W0ACC8_9STRA|nr:kinase [Thraustotheca clavata]